MPGGNYPKDRVASTKYESGKVSSGLKPVSNAGKESTKTGRAGKSK